MDIKDLRQKTINELQDQLKKSKKDLKDTFEAVLQRKEKNVKKVSHIKKDIAVINTVIRQKEIFEEKGQL